MHFFKVLPLIETDKFKAVVHPAKRVAASPIGRRRNSRRLIKQSPIHKACQKLKFSHLHLIQQILTNLRQAMLKVKVSHNLRELKNVEVNALTCWLMSNCSTGDLLKTIAIYLAFKLTTTQVTTTKRWTHASKITIVAAKESAIEAIARSMQMLLRSQLNNSCRRPSNSLSGPCAN